MAVLCWRGWGHCVVGLEGKDGGMKDIVLEFGLLGGSEWSGVEGMVSIVQWYMS